MTTGPEIRTRKRAIIVFGQRRLLEQVKAKRLELGLSIRSAAAAMGIGFSTLARLERGTGLPDDETDRRMRCFVDGTDNGDDDPPDKRPARAPGATTWMERTEARIAELERRVDSLASRVARGLSP